MAETHMHYFNRLLDTLGVEHTQKKKIDKEKITRANLSWLLNKTAQMFDYEGLPATIPKMALERLLQWTGAATIWNVPTKYKPVGFGPTFNYTDLKERLNVQPLYAFPMNLADAPDPYQEPYKAIITSPGFLPEISEIVELNKDCVIIRNDTNYRGLYRLHKKYAALLTEAEISLQSTLILLRDQMTFICKNEKQRNAVSEYINAREAGEYAAILAPDLGSPLELLAHDGRSNAVELAVNGVQAIKAAWYNEIGLNPSFSLKREYTSAQEIDTNTDLLMPIIDDMFYNRQQGVDNINALFGTEITVKKSSAWEVKDIEIENALAMEQMEMVEHSTNEGGENNAGSGSDIHSSSEVGEGES